MTALERHINAIRDGMKKLGATACFDDFILRNGRAFRGRPLPSRYQMRLPKLCYWNSYRLVKKSKTLRYCEGYVARDTLPVPILHAWAIDLKDQVVEVTLRGSGDWQYFGIVFEREHLDPAREGSGLLCSHVGVPNLDLWFKIDPGFKDLLPKDDDEFRF